MIFLAELQGRIDKGELSPDGALAQSLEAIATYEKAIGAFASLAEAPCAQKTGRLRGIAVGIKDIIETSDLPTEMGSPIYRGFRPRADAPVVMMLKRAGATIVGKTMTTAFAANDPTATLNPRNHGYTPGGSSSGSAAAVAAGMVPLALGTQTAGSVIRPASFCGVAAIKPSYRMLPTVGVKCFSWTLDTVGLFAAGVEDVALALSAMTGRLELLGDGAVKAPRIGLLTQDFAGSPDEEGSTALEIARGAAERSGARVQVLELPDVVAQAWRIQPIIQNFEAHRAFAWEYRENYDAMPPLLRARLDESRDITVADYDAACAIALRARAALRETFQQVDALLTLSAPGAAPKGLASTGDPRFNRLWTLMGTPSVNVPAHIAAGGLPVGVQVVAGYGDDAKTLGVAGFLEAALKLHR
jgi:Asp-tRNA(Asn)/Glu-tRNA(Gln) amidotransferase A subunit family amidase